MIIAVHWIKTWKKEKKLYLNFDKRMILNFYNTKNLSPSPNKALCWVSLKLFNGWGVEDSIGCQCFHNFHNVTILFPRKRMLPLIWISVFEVLKIWGSFWPSGVRIRGSFSNTGGHFLYHVHRSYIWCK